MNLQTQIHDVTPRVAADINAAVLTQPGPREAVGSGSVGSALAGPLVRIAIARLFPILESQALGLLDARVAQLQHEYPTLDLSFLHGLVQSIFNEVQRDASGLNPSAGTAGPVDHLRIKPAPADPFEGMCAPGTHRWKSRLQSTPDVHEWETWCDECGCQYDPREDD